ncbi:MAG TPA: right-handed parallel beta-helix repeat-containing protein [Terriglobales bacterium]|nr:right-handed parallel beta-helix repeat-containing protein [Terriglobales bacterium]
MPRWAVAILTLLLCFGSKSFGSTIRVPQDQPTIQAGINVANSGDTVLVAPGTYNENITFEGKAITVTTSSGPNATIIDGGGVAPVVSFTTNELTTSVLSGFTLQNGSASSSGDGGGVYIFGASPTVTGNVIENSVAGNFGGGVGIDSGSPIIRGNLIRNNSATFGGGISVNGECTAQIISNKIYGNSATSAGGGMNLFDAGTPTIEDNFIYLNSAGDEQGGGMWIVNDSDALIIQNLIADNDASQGSAIYFLVPSGSQGPTLVNNTIAGVTGLTQVQVVWAGGFDSQAQFFNNIVVGLTGQDAIWCDDTYSQQPPMLSNNDAWSVSGTGFQGTCTDQGQQNGNISTNPQWVNPRKGNFQLRKTSPVINAGDNSAPDLPTMDLANHQRIVGGTVDMGGYEYQGTIMP